MSCKLTKIAWSHCWIAGFLLMSLCISLAGCKDNTPIAKVVFEGWDAGESKLCLQSDHLGEIVLQCGHVSGETLGNMQGASALADEYRENGPIPKDKMEEIKRKGRDEFFYKVPEYKVRFLGAARPIKMGDDTVIAWNCTKDATGLQCATE